jgi:hypothetical protein
MKAPPAVDASAEVDFGNIDVFRWDRSVFELEGDRGSVRVVARPPTVRDATEPRRDPQESFDALIRDHIAPALTPDLATTTIARVRLPGRCVRRHLYGSA